MMKKIAITAIFTAALATGMILAITTYTPFAAAEYFYCSERQTFSAFNNIVVPEGETCILDQWNVVQGDIEVKQGATLVICPDNDIIGNVIADGAETVHITDILAAPCVWTTDVSTTSGAIGSVTWINNANKQGKIARTDDASNKSYQYQIPRDLADPNNAPVVNDCVTFDVAPSKSKVANNVAKCSVTLPPPKALGLVIMGSIDIRNTANFSLIGNIDGISIVKGNVIVQNTENVKIVDVAGVSSTGFGIGGDLEISASTNCIVSGNVVSGSTEFSSCSNLTS